MITLHSLYSTQAAVPAQILLATALDDYRKPNVGMWNYFVEHGNEGRKPGRSHTHHCNVRCLPLLLLCGAPVVHPWPNSEISDAQPGTDLGQHLWQSPAPCGAHDHVL